MGRACAGEAASPERPAGSVPVVVKFSRGGAVGGADVGESTGPSFRHRAEVITTQGTLLLRVDEGRLDIVRRQGFGQQRVIRNRASLLVRYCATFRRKSTSG